MPVQIIHKFICDCCLEETIFMPIQYYPNMPLPIPHLPEGWRQLDGLILCPKHEVKIVTLVDGKKIKEDL